MTKEEIYEHLAQVYIGKKTNDKRTLRKKRLKLPRETRVLLTLLIVGLAFYTLTAFLSRRNDDLKSSIIFALSNAPIRIKYDLNPPFPQIKDFSISIPQVDIGKYRSLNFSIRGLEEGYPNIVKVVLKNKRNETAFKYIKGVDLKWNRYTITFDELSAISDFTNLSEVNFVLEAWNVKQKRGIILIDDLCFSK